MVQETSVQSQVESYQRLKNTKTSGSTRPGSNGNEEVIYIPKSSRTRASPSQCLKSYLIHVGRRSYLSAEMQSVYSTAPAVWSESETNQAKLQCFVTGTQLEKTLLRITSPSASRFTDSTDSQDSPALSHLSAIALRSSRWYPVVVYWPTTQPVCQNRKCTFVNNRCIRSDQDIITLTVDGLNECNLWGPQEGGRGTII